MGPQREIKRTKEEGGKYEGQMERTIRTGKWSGRECERKTNMQEAEDRKRKAWGLPSCFV